MNSEVETITLFSSICTFINFTVYKNLFQEIYFLTFICEITWNHVQIFQIFSCPSDVIYTLIIDAPAKWQI